MTPEPRPIICGPAYNAASMWQGAGNSYQASQYDPAAQGCRHLISTGRICGDQQTVTADAVNGRRCAIHPPRFSAKHARGLAEHRDDTTLGAYLRTWIAAELEHTDTEEAAA